MRNSITAQDLILLSHQLENDSRMHSFISELEKQGVVSKYLHLPVYEKLISELKLEPFFQDRLGDNFNSTTIKHNFLEPLATMLLNSVYQLATDIHDAAERIISDIEKPDFSIIFFAHLALKAYSAQIDETIRQYISEYIEIQKRNISSLYSNNRIEAGDSLKDKIEQQSSDWTHLLNQAFPAPVAYDSDIFKTRMSLIQCFRDEIDISKYISFVPQEIFFEYVFNYMDYLTHYRRHEKSSFGTSMRIENPFPLMEEAEKLFKMELISKAIAEAQFSSKPTNTQVDNAVKNYCTQKPFYLCDDYINIVIYVMKKGIERMMSEVTKYLEKPDISHIQNGIDF